MDKLRRQVEELFDDFVDAFLSFNGEVVSRRYCAPYLAMDGDGAHRCFNTQSEIARYFQEVLDYYAGRGCRSCRYNELTVSAISGHSTLATVTWELLREDRTVIDSWRESYHLMHKDEELLIFVSIDHTE